LKIIKTRLGRELSRSVALWEKQSSLLNRDKTRTAERTILDCLMAGGYKWHVKFTCRTICQSELDAAKFARALFSESEFMETPNE
jgi:hypothetical protein